MIDCANAGKHIFCEKPMAMDSRECEEMEAAAKRNNVKLQIGFMRRHDASFIQAKEVIDSGVIGDVVLIQMCIRDRASPLQQHSPASERKWELPISSCSFTPLRIRYSYRLAIFFYNEIPVSLSLIHI